MTEVADGAGSSEVTVLGDVNSSRTVLFSVGSGGNPLRHLDLLSSLAAESLVVAPHFDRLTTTQPSAEQLLLRASRLRAALASSGESPRPVVGVGHSIGATVLLALAGARIWMGPDEPVDIEPIDRLQGLALLAPASGYFFAPGAVDQVKSPVLAWVGSEDHITPPSQIEMLVSRFREQSRVDLRVVDGAGHFSFLDDLPHGVQDPLQEREEFLAEMAASVSGFARAL